MDKHRVTCTQTIVYGTGFAQSLRMGYIFQYLYIKIHPMEDLSRQLLEFNSLLAQDFVPIITTSIVKSY